METIKVTFYGKCYLTTRKTVLDDFQYQYEGTETGYDGCEYDIYSNYDGDYFAVKENE